MLNLGEVRLPTDKDYENIRELCESDQGWTIDFTKNNLKIWTKQNELSPFKMIRAWAEFSDVSATVIYNVIQDDEYRRHWDTKLDSCHDICYITPCSNIGYYAIKSPKPFKNRDFVTQQCWLDLGPNKDKILFNHSVNHAKCPPKKGYVRGLSFITATVIKPTSPKSCILYYVTQSDPGGSFPVWVVNSATRVFAPKFMKKIYKASLKYEKWKAKHNPGFMPWVNPDQFSVARIDWNDIQPLDLGQFKKNQIDESQIAENQVQENDADDD
ncbi:hypothetical protein BpHYR1_037335 [Brachionus plicatilis]|uniref:START domain-containing protein 10 n=1 Tax=Brachionus plicatilis TaxID=10195 RepID=A0A3M7R1A4_BRAPC|nr:hypothetical protein BpHYR1_037335 [Brachionus plicatilis]